MHLSLPLEKDKEQGRDRERDMNNQESRDGRLEEMQLGGGRQQVQPIKPRPQPQQCPRCRSLNTKFCYYNNYKLTQPRYFCKSCKRNWTRGGILRNIPIGGNCRKAKRARISSSSRSQQSPPPPQEVIVQMHPSPPPPQDVTVQTQQTSMKTVMKAKDLPHAMASSIGPFYQGGGAYMSPVVAVHSMNPSQSHPYGQSLRAGVDAVGSSSDLGLASSLIGVSFASQHQIRPSQFYRMGSKGGEEESFHVPQGLIIPSNMASSNTTVASQGDLPHSIIKNASNKPSHSSLGCAISGSTTSVSDNVVVSSASIPNQWPNSPGCGPIP